MEGGGWYGRGVWAAGGERHVWRGAGTAACGAVCGMAGCCSRLLQGDELHHHHASQRDQDGARAGVLLREERRPLVLVHQPGDEVQWARGTRTCVRPSGGRRRRRTAEWRRWAIAKEGRRVRECTRHGRPGGEWRWAVGDRHTPGAPQVQVVDHIQSEDRAADRDGLRRELRGAVEGDARGEEHERRRQQVGDVRHDEHRERRLHRREHHQTPRLLQQVGVRRGAAQHAAGDAAAARAAALRGGGLPRGGGLVAHVAADRAAPVLREPLVDARRGTRGRTPTCAPRRRCRARRGRWRTRRPRASAPAAPRPPAPPPRPPRRRRRRRPPPSGPRPPRPRRPAAPRRRARLQLDVWASAASANSPGAGIRDGPVGRNCRWRPAESLRRRPIGEPRAPRSRKTWPPPSCGAALACTARAPPPVLAQFRTRTSR